MKLPTRLWGGYVDGALHAWISLDGYVALALFTRLEDAREQYEDVRRVEVRINQAKAQKVDRKGKR